MNKFAQEIDHAYAIGALQKLAEHQIDPSAFVEAATQSQHDGMHKIASAIVRLDQAVRSQEQSRNKEAYLGKAKNILGKLTGADEISSGVRVLRNLENVTPETAKMLRRDALGELGKGGAKALGLGGLGAGAIYAGGDADTTANQMRQMANENLGTDFDTESRLSQLLG